MPELGNRGLIRTLLAAKRRASRWPWAMGIDIRTSPSKHRLYLVTERGMAFRGRGHVGPVPARAGLVSRPSPQWILASGTESRQDRARHTRQPSRGPMIGPDHSSSSMAREPRGSGRLCRPFCCPMVARPPREAGAATRTAVIKRVSPRYTTVNPRGF